MSAAAGGVRSKWVRDPIHAFIELTPPVVKFVDAPVFQRLRGIAQLALTYLVYPGARHTRFEHSLGVMHVARRLTESEHLRGELSAEEREAVVLAGLLHDIGHGPFSHVLDGIIEKRVGEGIHEKISRGIIEQGLFPEGFQDANQAKAVADLFDPPVGYRSVAQDIVSGPTDADRLDYLRRDAHYCGVEYGRFDLERVIETARKVGGLAQPQLGFEEGGIDAVEGMLYARRSMFRQVYRHPTRRATDLMLIRALEFALSAGDEKVSSLVPKVDGEGDPIVDRAFLDRYVELDDEVVRRHLEGLEGPAGDLARALRERSLIHQLCQIDDDWIAHRKSVVWVGKVANPKNMTAEKIGQVEAEIASELGCEAHWVFVTVESETNPLYRAPGWDQAPGDVVIERGGLEPELFQELSDLWRGADFAKTLFLSLFTHRDEDNSDQFKDFDRAQWEDYLLEKIAVVIS